MRIPNVVSDSDVIRDVLRERQRYVAYLGAGVSVDAGVPSGGEIADMIREELLGATPSPETIKEIDELLEWNDSSARYLNAIEKGLKDLAKRISYFRRLLAEKPPSFSHHAIALLMKRGYLGRICLTTNFDKLLEMAFYQQSQSDCQAIRNVEELAFMEDMAERLFVLKLHGDCDTHNILNTTSETAITKPPYQTKVQEVLRGKGLLVLGTAGFEKSIHTLFDTLCSEAIARRVLQHGVFWGVYMGSEKPAKPNYPAVLKELESRLSSVSRDIRMMMNKAQDTGQYFSFFPVWGSANFLNDLVAATGDLAMIGSAQRYLDHPMRLRTIFRNAGLSDVAIKNHLKTLSKKAPSPRLKDFVPEEDTVREAVRKDGALRVRVIYADITSRRLMAVSEFATVRRAVLSPEDTCISAGGGVAKALLTKAGPAFILHELAKLSPPIEQGTVAVTSAGDLPVHYIFHAAAIEIGRKDATYSVTKSSVQRTMQSALTAATTLGVQALWIPLLGAGVANLPPKQSLRGILEALKEYKGDKKAPLTAIVVVYREKDLDRDAIVATLKAVLGPKFKLVG